MAADPYASIERRLQELVEAARTGTGITQAQVDTLADAIQAPRTQATPVFALTPGQAKPDDVIDYSTTVGFKRYQAATEPLKHLFDHKLGRTVSLALDLSKRAMESGWTKGTGDIITIPDSAGNDKNLIKHYGQLSLEDIKNKAQTYAGNPSRAAQNSSQMCTFLLDSLTESTRTEIMQVKDEWSIGEEGQGPMLFKVLMNKTIVDNNHTTRFLEDRFDELPQMMTTFDSDINRFHLEYREIVALLKGRGKTNLDEFKPLWRGYALCKDADFRDYMKRKEETYDDEYPNSSLTVEQLMRSAQNKYTLRTRQSKYVWGSSTKEENQIVALTAQVEQLKGNLKLAGQVARQYGKDKGLTKNKKVKQRKDDPEIEALKKTPPKDGETERTFGPKDHPIFKVEKTYYWCPYHMMWTLHKPEDCKKGQQQRQARENAKGKPKLNKHEAYQAFMCALAGDDPDEIFEQESSDEESDNEDDASEGSNL